MDRKNGPTVGFDRLAKSFDGGVSFAVESLNLEIAGGSFVALVGESGSGKSTLLKMINRLVDPSLGMVSIAGEPVDGQNPADLRRHIGYIF